MAGRPIDTKEKEDILRVVYILGTVLHWRHRRIGRVISHHHTSVTYWHDEAKRRFKEGSLAIEPEYGRGVRVISVGSTSDLEGLAGWANRHNRRENHEADDETADQETES